MIPYMPSISISGAISQYQHDIFIIIAYVAVFFIGKSIALSNLKLFRQSKVKFWVFIKTYIRRLIHTILNIIAISVLLLLIYIQVFNNLKKTPYISTDTSGADLALCAAIVAACATLYNVQRTLKQESTKNRQNWITSVRYATATLIATVDKIKLFEKQKTHSYFDEERHEKLYDELIESCTKLQMLINPNDAVAPMLTAQLDALANYYHEDLNNDKNHIVSIEEVDLRKSFMPWVLVLLKVEWERVKAILESREEMNEKYYSSDVYTIEWNTDKFNKYGVHIGHQENILAEHFSGFKFTEQSNKKILKLFNDIITPLNKKKQNGGNNEQDAESK